MQSHIENVAVTRPVAAHQPLSMQHVLVSFPRLYTIHFICDSYSFARIGEPCDCLNRRFEGLEIVA